MLAILTKLSNNPTLRPALGSLLLLALVPWQDTQSSRAATNAEPAKGTLLICGGGEMPPKVLARFVTLAGGENARIVLIPTASASADRADADDFASTKLHTKPKSITVLHTRSRDEADKPDFSAALRDATGVWFSGGDQSRLTAAYLGTRVHQELQRVLQRGGVIAGTSAGAACMSKVMVTGGDREARSGEGFGFVDDAIVDQHFLRRSRMNRLLGLLERNPGLAGFGIDEGTALELDANTVAVHGASYVVAISPSADSRPSFTVLHDGERVARKELADRAKK